MNPLRPQPSRPRVGLAVVALVGLVASSAAALAGLAVGRPLPASATSAVPGIETVGRHPDRVKPGAAGSVEIDPASLAEGRLVVTSDPVDGLGGAAVHLAATGDARIVGGPGTVAVPAEPAESDATVVVAEAGAGAEDPVEAALADATRSTVTATLTGTMPDGVARSASDTVWVDELEGATLVSELGEQDLRLQRVEVLRAAGRLSPTQAAQAREQILGAAASTTTVTEGGCGPSEICVSGNVRWTDRDGGLHAVEGAVVQVRDAETGRDEVVDTTLTDPTGAFSVVIDDDDGDGTGRDVYVRVLADGPAFTLDQHLDSAVTQDVAPGSAVVKDVTAGNVTDNNTAFSVHAALTVGGAEVALQNGALLGTVDVVFPSDGSYYDGRLNLLRLDRWDWDVILHEYGHFVSDELGIDRNPGGSHGDENLSDRYGKDRGIRLAWGEGWPTYFAVSTLHERAGVLGVPDAGDTRYQDTEDADIDSDLEATHTRGEDNEITVTAILWDLYDDVDDNRDQLALGVGAVWDTLDAGDPESLSEAYRLFSPGGSVDPVNCIASQMNVSPKISGAWTTVTEARPTFRWRAGNGGRHPNDRFQLKFRSEGGTLLLTTPTIRSTSFRPTRAQWDAVLGAAQGTVRVAVVGRQGDPPATGPYRSCSRAYTID